MPFFTTVATAIGSAITAIGGALAAAGISLAQIVIAGVVTAARIAFSYFNRPKKRKYTAVQGQIQFGGDIPRSAAYGTVATKGHRVYYARYGEGDKFNAEVFKLSDGWCDGLEPYIYLYGRKYNLVRLDGEDDPQNPGTAIFESWAVLTGVFDYLLDLAGYDIEDVVNAPIVGDILSTFLGPASGAFGTPADAYATAAEVWTVQGFGKLIQIRFYDGAPGQGPDYQLVENTKSLNNKWENTAVGENICYAVVEREWHETKFQRGIPEITFVLRGLREYDPREDDTVSGGSGDQRINDPSTWVWTENPAIHRLNYSYGVRGALSGRALVGVGMSLGQLHLPSHMTAATVADTTRTPGGGDPIPTYIASLIVQADDDHIEVLSEFEDALAGSHVNYNGLSGVLAGAPQTPVMEILPEHIRIDEGRMYKPRRSSFEVVNYISGQYIDPNDLHKPVSYTPVTVNADVASDGRMRQVGHDFLQVTNGDTAQYLANIRYRQNRYEGSASIPVTRDVGFQFQAGDWLTWNSKTWQVMKWSFDETASIRLDIVETNSDIYSETGIEPGPVVVEPSEPSNPSLASNISDFTVTAGLIEDGNGAQIPSLEFTWTPPEDPSITAVYIEYIRGNNPLTALKKYEVLAPDVEAGEFIVSERIIGGIVYSARATIRTSPDRFRTWTSWLPTSTALDVMNAYSSLALFAEDAQNAIQRLAEDRNRIQEHIEQLASDIAIGNGLQDESIEAISVTSNSLAAAIFQLSAVATETSANASLIASVSASVGQISAGGLISITGEADVGGGVESRVTISAYGEVDGDLAQASMFLETYLDGMDLKSRVIFDVESFIISDTVNGSLSPFAIDGSGNVLIANLIVGTSNLDTNAITGTDSVSDSATIVSSSSSNRTTWLEIESIDATSPEGNPIKFNIYMDNTYNVQAADVVYGTNGGRIDLRLRRDRDDEIVWNGYLYPRAAFSSGSENFIISEQIDDPSPLSATEETYILEARWPNLSAGFTYSANTVSSWSASWTIGLSWAKR